MAPREASQAAYLFDRTSRAILGVFVTVTGGLLLTVLIVSLIRTTSGAERLALYPVSAELAQRAPSALILGLGISLYLTVTVLVPLSQQARRRNWARHWHAWVLAGGLVTLPISLALQFATSGDRPFVDLGGLVFLFGIGAAAGLAGFLGMRRRA